MFLHGNTGEIVLFWLFAAIIILFLVIDLGFLHKNAEKITFRSALNQSLFWVAISLIFAILVYFYAGGQEYALEYLSAYFTEKALSIDNIFVIILILQYFKVDEIYYHRILFWGILGAIIFRGIFIFLGAYLVAEFYWILYLFGFFLLYSGLKLFFEKSDEKQEPGQNWLIKQATRLFPVSYQDHKGKFWIWKDGKMHFTSLFLVLFLIEITDLIFAVDSIPAAFAITQDEFIIYTSNIFAVMGLRAMFFLLAGVLNRFYLLQKALSLILVFIGAKMLLEYFNLHVPTMVSFAFILSSLIISVLLSLMIPERKLKSKPQKP